MWIVPNCATTECAKRPAARQARMEELLLVRTGRARQAASTALFLELSDAREIAA